MEAPQAAQSASPQTPDLAEFSLDEEDDEAEAEGDDADEGGSVVDEVAHVDPYELADSDGEIFAALERAGLQAGETEDNQLESSDADSEAPLEAADPGPPPAPAVEAKPPVSADAVTTAPAPIERIERPEAVQVQQVPMRKPDPPPAKAAPIVSAVPKAEPTRPVPAAEVRQSTTPSTAHTPSTPSRVNANKKPRVVNDSALVAGWHELLARTRRHPDFPAEYTSCFGTEGKSWLKASRGKGRFVLGIDCEMVYAKDDKDALARVSVVSCSGVIYDAHVQKRAEDVLDYRTRISGVEAHHLLAENG
ncbi:rex4, partial [Symbiodinium pilosum]